MAQWKELAAAKVARTLEEIPPEWRLDADVIDNASMHRTIAGEYMHELLNEGEKQIVTKPAEILVNELAARKHTAVDVTRAFCRSAAIAHQIVSRFVLTSVVVCGHDEVSFLTTSIWNPCLHEVFFDQALERAKFLDQYMQDHKTPFGPLHGLPVSLKDQFHVKGVDTTMGYIGWIGTFEGRQDPALVHNVNSQIVDDLLSLGAVLYCKTSLPQTLLLGETVNNLIGQTLNPINRHLSCGGSSGGEAALQALSGSPVGLGTDIGGSVRIPAAFCGIFSVKPTHNRLSYRDVANTNAGQDSHASSVGVMGRTIDAVKLVLESLISCQPWLRDPNVVPIPWRPEVVEKTLQRAKTQSDGSLLSPLKFGIYSTDGVVTPHPPVARGLKIIVDAIQKAGHKVVEWDPPSHATARRIHLSLLKADGAHDIHKQLSLSGEPLIPDLQELFRARDPDDLLDYQERVLEGKRIFKTLLTDTGGAGQIVDAVIMPVAPHAVVIPGKYYYAGYTGPINLLDYSAVVIPVTRADKKYDRFDPNYTPLNDLDQRNWKAYDPEIYWGSPVGLQIIARKYDEEKIWAIGKVVHDILVSQGYVEAIGIRTLQKLNLQSWQLH